MNEFTITGTVHKRGPVIQKRNRSRTGYDRTMPVILKTDEKYPQYLYFLFKRDTLARKFMPPDQVRITFRIEGWEFKGQHYVKLQGKNIERIND